MQIAGTAQVLLSGAGKPLMVSRNLSAVQPDLTPLCPCAAGVSAAKRNAWRVVFIVGYQYYNFHGCGILQGKRFSKPTISADSAKAGQTDHLPPRDGLQHCLALYSLLGLVLPVCLYPAAGRRYPAGDC